MGLNSGDPTQFIKHLLESKSRITYILGVQQETGFRVSYQHKTEG
jgi:hypothetical protein